MTWGYVARRVATFLVVVWLALTVNFILPRVTTPEVSRPRGQTASQLRLDQPLPQQYFSYLGDLARFDLSYSLSSYPNRVADVIGSALPWTIVLLGTTSTIAWLLGTLLGAALAWPGGSDQGLAKASFADPQGQSVKSSSAAMRPVLRAFGRTPGRAKLVQFVFPPLMLLSAAPYFITAMLLLYLLAFKLRLFPQGGGYEAGTVPDISPTFALNLVQHAVLAALSIVLASIATWAIGMRALVVSLKDEDYMLLAEAKGLRRPTSRRVRYCRRRRRCRLAVTSRAVTCWR